MSGEWSGRYPWGDDDIPIPDDSLNRREFNRVMAQAIIDAKEHGLDIPDEIVNASKSMVEMEDLNDQLIYILTTAKALLSGFDPKNPDVFPENLKFLKRLMAMVIIPLQNFGDRVTEYQANLKDLGLKSDD